MAHFFDPPVNGYGCRGFDPNIPDTPYPVFGQDVADLKNTDLSSVAYIHTNLSGANLDKADLSNANLSSIDLRGVNLSDANLDGANLNGTYLDDVNLRRIALPKRFFDEKPYSSHSRIFNHN